MTGTVDGFPERVPALDGLRGCAALFVLLFHFTLQLDDAGGLSTAALKTIFLFGWSGVDLFFVLSGFLITGLLIGAKGSSNYFRVFYARRMLRILPLYYFALLLLFAVPVVIRLPATSGFTTALRDQAWFWFYLQNFHSLGPRFAGLSGPLWSLAIEEQFYLVWPLVVFLLSRKRALWVCVGCVFVSLAYRIVARMVVPHLDTYYATQARLDGLSIGSAIALVASGPNGLQWLKKYLPAAVSMSVIAIAVAGPDIRGPHRPAFPVLYLAVGILYGCVLIFAIEPGRSRATSFLESRVLGFFGRYSYALYVVHGPIMTVLWHVGVTPQLLSFGGSSFVGSILYVAILTAASTAGAVASWHFLEKHFLKLKRYFVYSNMTGKTKAPLEAPLLSE
jgi:peptidoglycan/LPS O-acetylase OafA/YrhL